MKILATVGSSGLVLAALLTASPANKASCTEPDSSQARQLFAHPPREYSTGPLWVWNDLLSDKEIRGTLRDLAAQHVKQVWVHPRPGLMTPYLSAEWFRLWKVALREARGLDMNVWIYDENSYPSGFAGGQVPELMPESRGRGLLFLMTNTVPTCVTNILKVYALDTDSAQEVTSRVLAGEALDVTNYLVVSEVRSTNAAWNGNRSYVNLLSPGVTEKFLDLTLEPYRLEIGKEFGRRVPGVFTDEPNIRPSDGWPWSEVLDQEFQKRWGYSLLDQLPSLAKPIGDWRRVRYQYFQVLNDQFIEHWSKPYHDYCARYGLQWTGHYWDHDWPQCLHVPDNMAMYAWHQTPAIDCLMNQYEERIDSQFGNVRMVKELSSVANQLGMKRTLCETYGAGGWDLRFEDMKRIADWLEVLGVNLIDQHLSYVTLRGARKRDHPQSFSYHEPWWEAYHVSADYLSRLSAALSQGEQVNEVLVLEPTTTAWMFQGDAARLKELGKSFFELEMSLESAQIEYDIGSEDLLRRHGSAGPLGLRVGRRDYRTVIVPPGMETMNEGTAALLETYLTSGGIVLACGPAPTRIDGALSPKGAELSASPQWKTVTPDQLMPMVTSKGLVIRRQPRDKGILFHNRRRFRDGELVFLVNTSLKAESTGVVDSSLSGVQKWDLYTGKIEPYPFESTAKGVTAGFTLNPSGSLLLFLSAKPLKPIGSPRQVVSTIEPAGPPSAHRRDQNVLVLDYVDVTAGGETRSNIYCYAANQFVWKQHRQDGDPWDSAVQFGSELISKTFPAASGFEATYKFRIEGFVPTNLAIIVERPDLYKIICNGKEVRDADGSWWLDKSFGRLPIASEARAGQNCVTIKAAPLTMYHELEAAYVVGDFSLAADEHGFVVGGCKPLNLQACGAGTERKGWNSDGHPFYGGGVSYDESFVVGERRGQFAVALPDWYGSVAKVEVNGKFAGYIDAPPWQCDVTKWIKTGKNDVEVTVIGTLKNTLGPHHGNPPLGAAWPKRFQTGPDIGPPPGTNYSTVAYGLFRPFVLRRVEDGAAGSR